MKSATLAKYQMGMWFYLVYMCCYSNLSSNHAGCPIMTLNFTNRQSSIRPRASLTLLNIYYFRFKIFIKGTFKRLFKKTKCTLSENFGGGGQVLHLPPPCSRGPAVVVKKTVNLQFSMGKIVDQQENSWFAVPARWVSEVKVLLSDHTIL